MAARHEKRSMANMIEWLIHEYIQRQNLPLTETDAQVRSKNAKATKN